jgi:hypothetical protein
MEITFLGHQGWSVSHGDTHVLLDPILCRSFGHSSSVEFEIYPPRDILLDKMPRISAVVLSHEHLDHFHLPSLAKLTRSTPILMGELMPSCVVESIERLGFVVTRVPALSPIEIGDLQITLYPASCNTVFWEKRVYQLLVSPLDGSVDSLFVAVDALTSDTLLEHVGGKRIALRAAICTNNSQITRLDAVGAHTNLLPIVAESQARLPGLQVLHSVLIEYLKDLPHIPDLVLCGNGFVSSRGSGVPFLFSEHDQLSALAQALALRERVFGPLPGQRLVFGQSETTTHNVNWIVLDQERFLCLQNESSRRRAFQISPLFEDAISDEDHVQALEVVRKELPALARDLLSRKVGLLALSTNEFLAGSLGPCRILFRFLGASNEKPLQFALNFSTCSFEEDFTPTDQLLTTYPFGVEMYLSDFAAVLTGKAQIWDLAGCGMRSWYIGDKYHNIVASLFEIYGEQLRPDLASTVYHRVVDRLLLNPDARHENYTAVCTS